MRNFSDRFFLGHCLLAAHDSFPCKEDATALDTLYECGPSASKILLNFEKLIDEFLLVLLEFSMLTSP
jgi:hypothetical protein